MKSIICIKVTITEICEKPLSIGINILFAMGNQRYIEQLNAAIVNIPQQQAGLDSVTSVQLSPVFKSVTFHFVIVDSQQSHDKVMKVAAAHTGISGKISYIKVIFYILIQSKQK